MTVRLGKKLIAEALATGILVATVVGSGIMAANLSGGNQAIALLGNTLPTGAILVVLITIFGPISGAHLNPAVSLVMASRGELPWRECLPYSAAQIAGAVAGTFVARMMFDLPLLQLSSTARTGPSQWLAEFIASYGLLMTIVGTNQFKPKAAPTLVGLYITAAYWFTASTSFANPAVTIGRSLTNTFSGIDPVHAPAFIAVQFAGAFAGAATITWLSRQLASSLKSM